MAAAELKNLLAPILLAGDWVDIGYDSALKLSGESLLHRYNGRSYKRSFGWLVEDRPLLNWILSKNSIA